MDKAHKKLNAWNEAMDLSIQVYRATSAFPSDEKYGLISQMRRAAVSIPSNIAEGAARQSKKQTIQFYMIARGSLSELDTQLEICRRLPYVSESASTALQGRLDAVDALLSGLIRYVKSQAR